MDERLESLKRAHREDPSDLAVSLRLAHALEKAARLDEAWELLDRADAKDALASFAARNQDAVLARLRALDYPRARVLLERLAAIGREDLLLVLAAEESADVVAKKQARRLLGRAAPEKTRTLLVIPWFLSLLVAQRHLVATDEGEAA